VFVQAHDIKRCSRCKLAKSTSEFYAGRHWRDGKHPWCKVCFLADQRIRWRESGVRKTAARWARAQNLRVDYFSVIDSPIKAYILGLLAADGNVLDAPSYHRITLELSARDLVLLEFVRDELSPGQPIRFRTRGAARDFGIFSFSSATVRADLARYGIVPNKSLRLEWPQLDRSMQRSFLLGYFDGDGFITSSSRPSGLIYPYWGLMGTRQFLIGALELIRTELGLRIPGPWPHQRIHVVRAAGRSARLVDDWLHQDGLGLARKRITRQR
jgi:hypothetical protein